MQNREKQGNRVMEAIAALLLVGILMLAITAPMRMTDPYERAEQAISQQQYGIALHYLAYVPENRESSMLRSLCRTYESYRSGAVASAYRSGTELLTGDYSGLSDVELARFLNLYGMILTAYAEQI